MSERHCVFAYTRPPRDGECYPPFFNFMREPDGGTVLIGRGAEDARGGPGQDVRIELPLAEFRKMIDACRDEELVQCVGALIHGGKS